MTNEFPIALPGATAETLMWARPHEIEHAALRTSCATSPRLPWVHGVRVMPDVHHGKGATVGSVIAMRDAVSPAAVGVDIGCGMQAVRTASTAADLPDDLGALRSAIEAADPGRVRSAQRRRRTCAVRKDSTTAGSPAGDQFWGGFDALHAERAATGEQRATQQMGTLGGGNHFIEADVGRRRRGVADAALRVAQHRQGARRAAHRRRPRGCRTTSACPTATWRCSWPARRRWTPTAATSTGRRSTPRRNRAVMMALGQAGRRRAFAAGLEVAYDEPISCHHNYVARGDATTASTCSSPARARSRPAAASSGSSRARWAPARTSCAGSATRRRTARPRTAPAGGCRGRRRSRTFTVDDLAAQTAGVECRKDAGVVDEIPGAYKDLERSSRPRPTSSRSWPTSRTLLCVKG